MRGKIVSYDPIKGIGKIIIKNEGVRLFSIDKWIDYENTPKIGLEVEFSMDETNQLVDISSVDSSNSLLNELKKEFEYIPIPNLKIEANIPLEECLEDLFKKYKKIALKYEYLLKKTKSLPYKKIKRFLMTAYNNLIEMDYTINDKNLVNVKDKLSEIEYYYDDLLKMIKSPIYTNLEKFVLNRQSNYLVMKKRFERNKELSVEAIKKANLLEIEINKLKNEISKLSPKSKEYKEIEEQIKSKKRKYVDLIDSAQNLKEENSLIVDDLTKFEKVYQDLFKTFFEKQNQILKQILEKEMNILAYDFDTLLWENAKKSQIIQKFFEEAEIEGSYSTKTFMKYYLKTLSNDKMNKQNQELLDTLEELNIFSKNILIYDKNLKNAKELSNIIENIEHDSNVKIIDSLKKVILEIKENAEKIDLVILETESSTLNIIEKIVFILEKIGIRHILFSREINNRKDILYIDNKNLQLFVKDLRRML